MAFESLQSTPFCLEKISVKKGLFNVLTAFSVRIWLEYAIITITHVCFIALICRIPREMFGHSAYWPCVQTRSSGPGKC